jgi:hypothetical protein
MLISCELNWGSASKCTSEYSARREPYKKFIYVYSSTSINIR